VERRISEKSKTQTTQIGGPKVKTKFLPFEEARRFARSLGIKGERK
jgi:hypothetical protein